MAGVAYELAIVGGELSANDDEALSQTEELDKLVRRWGGVGVGPLEYHFASLDNAKEAAHQVRQMVGIKFDDIQIRTVDAATGKELPS